MKYSLLLSMTLTIMSASTAFGQLLIDKSIDLTGTGSNARVMGIKQVSDAEDAVSAEALQKGGLIYAAVTGGPNSYTLNFSPAISSPYSEGMVVLFKATGDNTASVTLNGIPLRKDVSSALAAGDIKDNQIVTVVYDGANFQLASRTADSNSGGSVTSVSTAAANNGVSATWTNPTTTPALTIGLGNITPNTVAATGTVTGSNLSGTNTGDQSLSGLGGVPASTTLNINGTTQDLSTNRTWNVGTVTSVSTAAANNGVSATWSMASPTPALTIGLGAITPSSISTAGNIATTSGNITASGTITATGAIGGSNFSGSSSGTNTGDQSLSGLGGVPLTRTISTTAPLTGGGDLSANRTFAITQATTSSNGYLSNTDWNTFNSKESALTFSNGLTRTSNAITWGGSLTGNTTVAQTDKTLAFTSTVTNGFSVDGTTFSVDAANNRVGIGTAAPAHPLTVVANGQSNAAIGARAAGANTFEWGHSNTAGYGSTIGFQNGGGQPFIAFSAEAGTTSNTYRTRGHEGTVILGDLTGGLSINSVAAATADNQSLTTLLSIAANGTVTIPSLGGSGNVQVYADNSGNLLKATSSLPAAGSVVQMKFTQTRTQSTFSVPISGNGVQLTPLDIAVTPTKAGNAMLLQWVVNGETHHNVVYTVTRNGTILTNATDGTANKWSGVATHPFDNDQNSSPSNMVISIIDANTLSTATTYAVHVRSSENTTTYYLNRTVSSTGAAQFENMLSTGTATEIQQ